MGSLSSSVSPVKRPEKKKYIKIFVFKYILTFVISKRLLLLCRQLSHPPPSPLPLRITSSSSSTYDLILPLSSHPHPPPSPLPFPLLNALKKKNILKLLFLNKYLPLSSQRGFCFFADNYLILLPLLVRFPCLTP